MTSTAAFPRQTLLAASTRATVASIVGNVPGFFIPIAIAAFLGATAATDAFFLALSIASLVANSIGATTQQAAIPFLVEARGPRSDARTLVGEMSVTLLLFAAAAFLIVYGVLILFIFPKIYRSETDYSLIVGFLWSLAPFVAFSVLAGLYSAVLNANHAYVRVALSLAVRSLVVLAAVLFAPKVGVYPLVAGYLIGELVRVIFLNAPVRHTHRTRLVWPRSDIVRQFSRTLAAQALGAGILALLPVLDRIMAAGLAPGSVSLLEYADRLWQVPVGFAMSGFMVTSLAHWSERFQRTESFSGLSTDTFRAVVLLFAASVPVSAAIIWYRGDLVHLVFGTGKLLEEELRLLADMLAILIAGLPIYIAGLVYSRAFLILRRSDLIFGINMVQLAIKATANVLLVGRLGLIGLVTATAVTYGVSSLLLALIFHFYLVRAASPAVLPVDRPSDER